MGLDITAISNATHVKCNGEDCWPEHQKPTTDYQPLQQSDGLKEGCYRGDSPFEFKAGSYTGYNEWREHLCRLVHGVEPQTVWDHVDQYAGKPFVELIHFSDCEGTIGPRTSAKLLKDFTQYLEGVKAAEDEWFVESYKRWMQAFEIASRDGFVAFH